MKTFTSKALSAVAIMLVMATLMMLIPAMPVSALTYSEASSSYKSGVYYRRLTAVELTGVQRLDITNVANSQVGYQEGSSSSSLSGESYGGSNYTEYGRWYDMQDMWCAMFVSWCAYVCNIPSSIITYHSYTPTGLSWFKNRGQAYSRATVASGGYTPIKGDIIYFKSSRNQNTTNHIGIVTGYSNGTVYTVEGNTSSATISTNGGAVAAKSYSISNTYIVYICKPAYTTGTTTVASTYVNTLETSGSDYSQQTNNPTNATMTVNKNGVFNLQGWSLHSDGIDHFEWNINTTSWGTLNSTFRQDVANAYPSYSKCTDINAFSQEIAAAGLATGKNYIDIRGYTKKGNYYTVGRLTVIVMPDDSATSLSVPKTTVSLDEGVEFTAKGDHQYAWVGLFGRNDNPGEVPSYLWYEMGKDEVTINLMHSEGVTANSSRGEVMVGEYRLYLFVDADYIVDEYIDITITSKQGIMYCLDSPNPKTVEVPQGENIKLAGWALHNNGIKSFHYTIDDGAKIAITDVTSRADVLNAFPAYATSCADINGYSHFIATDNLEAGDHTIVIYATSKDGYEFVIGRVSANIKGSLSAKDDSIEINRDGDVNYVTSVKPGLSADEVAALFNENCTIVDANGEVVADGFVGTGCKAVYYNGTNIDDELVIIVPADVDGNGVVTAKDIIKMKKVLASKLTLKYEAAADVDGNGSITNADLTVAIDLMG